MSFVSDERAEIIRSLGRVFTMAARGCVNELLADRKKRIEREQAVIAKIEEMIKRLVKFGNWDQGTVEELETIKAFIRNPKETE